VSTWWNYTHAMICQAQLIQEAVDDYIYQAPGLRALLLTDNDWKILGMIADILE
ncbi:hypothetical protein L208DRAFT_1210637, partial [Tricholoma matsutake]